MGATLDPAACLTKSIRSQLQNEIWRQQVDGACQEAVCCLLDARLPVCSFAHRRLDQDQEASFRTAARAGARGGTRLISCTHGFHTHTSGVSTSKQAHSRTRLTLGLVQVFTLQGWVYLQNEALTMTQTTTRDNKWRTKGQALLTET